MHQGVIGERVLLKIRKQIEPLCIHQSIYKLYMSVDMHVKKIKKHIYISMKHKKLCSHLTCIYLNYT